MDEFIANIDLVLYERDRRSPSPAYRRLVGQLEAAVAHDRDESRMGGWRHRFQRLRQGRRVPTRPQRADDR
jgi:hypothetical protein